MKAITVVPRQAGSARLEDFPEPHLHDGSVLVEAIAVGVCGTDVEMVEGMYGWSPRVATLAVDLYSREGTPKLPDMDALFRWMAALPDRRVIADLHAARDFLSSHDAVRGGKVGVTGFCMGGQYALMAACARWGFRACVSWYGMRRYASTSETKPESPLDMTSRLTCPYLGFFGEQDTIIPLADVMELKQRLAGSKHAVEIHTYANACHAFFNDSRPEMYRPTAAADSWPRASSIQNNFNASSLTNHSLLN